ncbi:MAG: (cytosine-5)-methyltransferase 1, partial [Bacteroidota bacterium]|nr:(cytosine-5)-methyltransferase 1 [Bacteroidota bacterium]
GPLVVELFCGCGGTSKGFELAGYDIALGIDIHEPSIRTFSKNHPNTIAMLGDIKKITPESIKKLLSGRSIDVLIAGVPCQGFSLNNRKRHSDDKRNFLYKEFIKYISILKPKIAILENVSGMMSTSNGDFVKNIESDIAEAGKMQVSSRLLLAADYGVPQMRRRLVFIGIKNKLPFDFDKELKKTHGPSTNLPYTTIKDAISDLSTISSGEESFKYRTSPNSTYQKMMREKSPNTVFNHKAPKHPTEVINKIKNTEPGKPLYPKFKQRIRLAWNIQSPTQVSGGIRPQFQFGHPESNRGLTIRERCRIQSFPDDFIVEGGTVQGRVQTGNAVPPLLAKAIALAVKKYLKK